jgi:hypothetical protein
MPNNASARRVKDKKNKDKKGKGSKKTNTLSLPKEDTANVDSGTLSLSSAGKDKSSKDIGPLVGKDGALDLSDPCSLEKAQAIRQKDKASLDGSSLSLSVVGKEQSRESRTLSPSVAGKEQARQGSSLALYERAMTRPGSQDLLLFLHQIEGDILKHAEDEDDSWAASLFFEHAMSTTMEERLRMNREARDKCREDNQLVSKGELKVFLKKARMKSVLEWRRGVIQGEKDFLLSSALSERIKDDELLVRGPAQDALLKEHALSLTLDESVNTYAVVKEANPKAGAKELGKILWAAKVQAAFAWRKNKVQDGKTSSLPCSEMTRHAESLSLEAQSKSDSSTTVRHYLSLTAEERLPVKETTRLANPDADNKAFNKAYKISLWKADSLKRGINPDYNWDDIEYAPISDTYSEDSGQESSSSSEDRILAIRKDLERQRRKALSPVENEYLDGLKKSSNKTQADSSAKQALDKDSLSLSSPFERVGNKSPAENQQRGAGDVTGHGGSVSAHHGIPSFVPPAVAQLRRPWLKEPSVRSCHCLPRVDAGLHNQMAYSLQLI